MLKVEALEAIRNPHQVRILLLLRERGPMRFNQIQHELGLNPAQVDRALKKLHRGWWLDVVAVPGTADHATKSILVEYRTNPKGERLLEAFDAFVGGVGRAGDPARRQLEGLYPA